MDGCGWRFAYLSRTLGGRADTIERPAREVAGLEQAMARTLVREIGGKLAGPRRAAGAESSPNGEVQDLYLRARYHLASRTPEGLQSALDYFRQVLARDPAHAAAYAGLAQYYSLLPFYTKTPSLEAFAKSRAAALRALRARPYLPEAHAALAYVLAYDEWDWTGAERAYRRALALQPSNADVYHALSRLHAARGRMTEAIAEAERAHALDPLSLVGAREHRGDRVLRSRLRRGTPAAPATLELDPNFSTAYWGLGLVAEQMGEYGEAIAEFQKSMAIAGRGSNGLASLGHVLAVSGRRAEAEEVLKELIDEGTDRPHPALPNRGDAGRAGPQRRGAHAAGGGLRAAGADATAPRP